MIIGEDRFKTNWLKVFNKVEFQIPVFELFSIEHIKEDRTTNIHACLAKASGSM